MGAHPQFTPHVVHILEGADSLDPGYVISRDRSESLLAFLSMSAVNREKEVHLQHDMFPRCSGVDGPRAAAGLPTPAEGERNGSSVHLFRHRKSPRKGNTMGAPFGSNSRGLSLGTVR